MQSVEDQHQLIVNGAACLVRHLNDLQLAEQELDDHARGRQWCQGDADGQVKSRVGAAVNELVGRLVANSRTLHVLREVNEFGQDERIVEAPVLPEGNELIFGRVRGQILDVPVVVLALLEWGRPGGRGLCLVFFSLSGAGSRAVASVRDDGEGFAPPFRGGA